MTTFTKGQLVQSTIDAQGLVRGAYYNVVDVQIMPTPFGNFVTYIVELVGAQVPKQIAVVNGHLLLEQAK